MMWVLSVCAWLWDEIIIVIADGNDQEVGFIVGKKVLKFGDRTSQGCIMSEKTRRGGERTVR